MAGNTGFATAFYIHRKRVAQAVQFLGYWEGGESLAASWPDSEDTAIVPTVTTLPLAPFGYSSDGVGFLTGNLGVNGDTITEFTIAAVLTRDEMTNNEGVIYGLFGSTHYPRIYFTGTTLTAEIKLDGNVKTVTVANVDTYIKKGQPFFLVFRGSAALGVEVLLDGVSRGTQTDTGTAYSVGSGGFLLGKDSNLSYLHKGNLRGVFATASRMSDSLLDTWRTMLEYEGYFDIWRDYFAKWSGETTVVSGGDEVGTSQYLATIVES